MILGKAFRAIMEEDIRHALKAAELWKRYAEVGEFRSEEGKKAIFAMGEHFRDMAEKRRARLDSMKDA